MGKNKGRILPASTPANSDISSLQCFLCLILCFPAEEQPTPSREAPSKANNHMEKFIISMELGKNFLRGNIALCFKAGIMIWNQIKKKPNKNHKTCRSIQCWLEISEFLKAAIYRLFDFKGAQAFNLLRQLWRSPRHSLQGLDLFWRPDPS